jgi:VCBS repeat-containing protein
MFWRRLLGRSPKSSRRPRRVDAFRLVVEALESRLAPAALRPSYLLAQDGAEPYSGYTPAESGGFTPQQMRHAYGFDQTRFNSTIVGDGTGQTIAIIDAFDNPNVSADLHVFDQTFSLPDPPSLQVVNENGGSTLPAANVGWGLEIALDVEWAHAIAPGANLLLVEANFPVDGDLLAAIDYARNAPGVAAVSMSFGRYEGTTDGGFDGHFQTPSGHTGVTFVASSGDNGPGVSFPANSARVVSVGGTTLTLDGSNNWSNEVGWSGSGGGVSTVVSQPGYQEGFVTQSGSKRGNPDVAYDADPATGVAVYDTQFANATPGVKPWLRVGGTSAGAPQWSALIAIADQGRALEGLGSLDSGSQTLPKLYQLSATDFRDVTGGSSGYNAGPGYDLVTGLGTSQANLLVADLLTDPVAPAQLALTALNLKNSGGAAITYASPGSTITSAPTVVDNGQQAATNVTLQVASSTPGVTIVGSSTQNLGTLNPGQPVQTPDGFQIQLDGGLTDLQQAQLTFTASYGAGQQQTFTESFYVVQLLPQAQQQVNFRAGNMVADPTRDLVYVLNVSGLEVLAINTDTGQLVAQASLAGTPNISPPISTNTLECGQLAVSVDGSRLYVALTDAREIQVFALPNLGPLATYSYAFSPASLACGVNNMLYVSTHTDLNTPDNLKQIDGLTGALLGEVNRQGWGTTYPGAGKYVTDTMLRASPDGTQLYASETELKVVGAPNYVYVYDVTGASPVVQSIIPYNQVYLGDFAVDSQDGLLFTANQGQTTTGVYGVEVTNIASGGSVTWPLDGAPFDLAYLPGSPVIYGGGGNKITRYLTLDGTQQYGTALGSYTLATSVPEYALKITPNGNLMYVGNNNGNYSIGIIGSGSLNVQPHYPIVTAINRSSPNPTTAGTVSYTVTFSEAVTGVAGADFAVVTSGISGANVARVTGSGNTYTVTVNTGMGSGSLQLDLIDDDSITDASGNPLNGPGAGNGDFNGQVYQVRLQDFQDPSFEVPQVGDGAFQNNPPASPWSFITLTTTAGSGVAGNGSTYTKANAVAPQGAQVAYLFGTGTISQVFSPGPGNYHLTFEAAQVGSMNPAPQYFDVKVDGQVVGTYQPASAAYASYTTPGFTLTDGQHTISFMGRGTSSIIIGDFTAPVALIDAVHLNNDALTVVDAATATPNPNTGTTTALHASATDDSFPDSALTYTWSSAAGVTFSANGTNAAQNTTATFAGAGTYDLQVTITDPEHRIITSSVSVAVNQRLTTITLTPGMASINDYESQTFTATAFDQFGHAFTTPPAFTWSIDSGGLGTISSAGVYSAPTSGSGTATIRTASGSVTATATETVLPGNVISDAGFEMPTVGTGISAFAELPMGTPWTFTYGLGGFSGVAGNGSLFTVDNFNAPEGTQVAFLENTASISQIMNPGAGTYTLSFQAAQEANSGYQLEAIQVQVDGVVINQFQPPDIHWTTYTTSSFTLTAGPHTIAFVGNNYNNAALLDNVHLNAVPTDLTVVTPQTLTVNEFASATGNVLTGAVDSEGAAITAPAGTFLTAHGSVTMAADGPYTYTPQNGYVGSDSFTFTAQTADDSASGTVNITINVVNDLSVASPSIVVNQNGSRSGNVLAGAADIEGATITAVAGTFATANGSVTIAADGSYTYLPNPGYVGSDSFSFTAQTADDSTGGTVSVTVTADANNLTVATPQALTVKESTPGTGNVLTGAADSEGATITAVAGTFATANGSVTIAPDGSYTYLPNPGYSGSDSFTFTAQTDDDSTNGTVSVTVNPVDDLTVASPTITFAENGVANGNVLTGASDSEGAATTVVAGTFATANGSVTIAADGSYTYLPNPGYFGSDSFSFTAQTADDSTGGTVSVTVVSGPPLAPSARRTTTRTKLHLGALTPESPAVTTFGTVHSKSAVTADATTVIGLAVRARSSATGSMDVLDPGQALRRLATAEDSNQPVWRELQRRLDGASGIQPLDVVAENPRVSRGRFQDGFAVFEGFAAEAEDLPDLVADVTLGRCR